MRLELIEGLRIIIIAVLSYLPTVAISGWFEAWVAKKCGDDVPEQFGFLTLDPMVHFNIIGFGVLLVGRLFGDYLYIFKDMPGWGRYIPLNPTTSNTGKIFLQFTARAIAHFFLLLAAFFILVGLMKSAYVQPIDQSAHVASSMIQAILSVLVFFYRQNFVLCVIYFVIGIFRAILAMYFPQFHLFSSQHMVWAIVVLVISVYVGSQIFELVLNKFLLLLAYMMLKQ